MRRRVQRVASAQEVLGAMRCHKDDDTRLVSYNRGSSWSAPMSLEIQPIELPRDTTRFVKSWWPIYADDPHWVPPLLFERKTFFNPAKNPYFKTAEV
jgi:hypothetical protein